MKIDVSEVEFIALRQAVKREHLHQNSLTHDGQGSEAYIRLLSRLLYRQLDVDLLPTGPDHPAGPPAPLPCPRCSECGPVRMDDRGGVMTCGECGYKTSHDW